MAASSSTFNPSATSTQARLQQTAQLAGITEAFGRTAALAAPVLALQQSLLGGMVRSQEREAKRLAARMEKGQSRKDDPRVQQALARVERLSALVGEGTHKAQQATRFVETFSTAGTFAGYVCSEDGAPAPDHTVTLQLTDKANRRNVNASARTAADGYFRMALGASAGTPPPPQANLGALVEQLLNAMADDGEAAAEPKPVKAAGTGSTQPAAGETVESRVQVLDRQGKVVLEDPLPPTFEVAASEFRYYVVPAASKSEKTDKPVRS